MSRGDKKYNKIVRSVKNKSADKKKKAIHKMVESLIKSDSSDAAEHLHDYLQIAAREIILGESDDDKESDDKESDDKESDDKESDDKESDDKDDDKESDDKESESDDKDDDKDDDKESDDDKDDK